MSSEGSREIEAGKKRLAAANAQSISATTMFQLTKTMMETAKKEVEDAELFLQEAEERWNVVDVDVDDMHMNVNVNMVEDDNAVDIFDLSGYLPNTFTVHFRNMEKESTFVRMPKNIDMSQAFDFYARMEGTRQSQCRFLLDGEYINPTQSPFNLSLMADDIIQVILPNGN
mmetsp:Transcript_8642/g.9908  ORF Transcript_8642/g.9908 Transcript_8642/m.9908 type:complete len:171 (+) Transcript_8642:97-609(+)